VLESRYEESPDDRPQVRRRRECLECGFRFTTFETIESGAVRGADGRRVRFSPPRLLRSLEMLGEDRPPKRELDEMVADIQRRVEAQLDAVDADTLVGWVAAELPTPEARANYLGLVRQLDPKQAERIAWGQVTKRNGQLLWFNRRKLRDSVGRAAHRFISADKLDRLVESIEQRVIAAQRPVTTEEIRAWVETQLWQLHELAGVRYAAAAPGAKLGQVLQRVTHVKHGYVSKKNSQLEAFDRRKLSGSVELALGKRVPDDAFWKRFDGFADKIAEEVAISDEPTSTSEIGRRVLMWLKDNDEVAFLNYLIIYRDLKAQQIMDELKKWNIELSNDS